VNRHDGTLSLSGKELNEGIDYFVRHAAANSGNKTVLFYGGEPLLNWNTVKNTIEIVRTKEREFNGHVNLVLFTNATVVTDSIANCLASSDVFVVVSVDGPAEFHDKMRVYPSGLGSFSKTRKGYFTLRDHGCKVGISTVIGSHNVDRLDEVVQYLNREFNPVDIGLSTLHFLPSGGNPALSGAQSTTASLIRVYEAARKHGLYVEHIMRRIRPFVEKTPRIKDCPACGGKILVAPGGKIGLCEIFTGLDKFLIHDSNLFSDPNYVMWNNRSQFLEESCLSCPALSLCGGGCPYDAYVLTGNLMGHDETRCVQSKQLLEWIIADLYRTLVTKLGDQRRQSEFALLVPSLQDRKLIYGNINYATPLDSYSTYGERVVV
jgi:radical SAM protein with 4Fe4S-binding SPASM domain